MAAAPQRGYSTLPWDHEKSLKAEVELAARLNREFTGKVMITSAGPDIRERFKPKFSLNVFSTPDLIFVPEFCDDEGRLKGYGPSFAFDVTERNYAPGKFPTVYAQVSKTDSLARFGPDAFLAYKWCDGSWTFARAADISKKFKPEWTPTKIRGEKARQHNYHAPRDVWFGWGELRAAMLGEIRNFEPIDHVELLRKIDGAREDDMEEYVGLLRDAFGEERFREVARYFLALKYMMEWNPERDLEPSFYIFQRVLGTALEKKRQSGLGAITDIMGDMRVLAVHIDKKGIFQKFKPAIMKSVITKVFKRHEGRWAGIRTLAREISREIGEPFSERRARAMMREIGFGQFKRDAKGRSHVFISPHVLAVVRIRGVGNERGREDK